MIVVLDASAAVRVARDEGAEFAEILDSADLVIAPDLINAEVCSALRKYVRAKLVSEAQAATTVHRALALVDEVYPLGDLVAEVLELTAGTTASAYDAFYLALARRQHATFITADNALRRTAASLSIPTCDPPR